MAIEIVGPKSIFFQPLDKNGNIVSPMYIEDTQEPVNFDLTYMPEPKAEAFKWIDFETIYGKKSWWQEGYWSTILKKEAAENYISYEVYKSNGHVIYIESDYHYSSGGTSHRSLAYELIRAIPGTRAMVQVPCNCGVYAGNEISVQTAIMHLNDTCKWSREEIADWLETLDVDLTIPIVNGDESNEHDND